MTALHPEVTRTPPEHPGISTVPQGDTSIMHCRQCEAGHLISDTRMRPLHRTSEGWIGYFRCATGHMSVQRVAEAYPKPKPPASVLELQARLAAAERSAESREDR